MTMHLTGNLNLFDQRSAKEYGYGSVKEHYEDFIGQWYEAVKPDDHVYILGNLSQYAPDAALKLIRSLPGQKHLMVGPRELISPDTKKGWMQAQAYYETFEYVNTAMRRRLHGEDCILSHYGPDSDVFWSPKPTHAYNITAWKDFPLDSDDDPWVTDTELSVSWHSWGRLVDWEEIKEMFDGVPLAHDDTIV